MLPTNLQSTTYKRAISDLNCMYPYIISKEQVAQYHEEIIASEIGHNLYSILVFDFDGQVQMVTKSDLESLKVKNKNAFEIALINLNSTLKSQNIKVHQYDLPNSQPFLFFSNHWLSSAAMLSPKFIRYAQKKLAAKKIFAAIPRLDALVVFPESHGEHLNTMKELVRSKDVSPNNSLAFNIFNLEDQFCTVN